MMRVFFSRDFYAEDNQSSSKKWKRQKKMGEGFIAHEYLPSTWVGPWGYLWCCFSRRGIGRYLRTVVWKINYVSFFAQHSRCTETHLTQTQDYIEAIIYHRLRMTPMVIAKIFTDKKNVACWLHISMVLNDTCVPRFWGPGPSSPPPL